MMRPGRQQEVTAYFCRREPPDYLPYAERLQPLARLVCAENLDNGADVPRAAHVRIERLVLKAVVGFARVVQRRQHGQSGHVHLRQVVPPDQSGQAFPKQRALQQGLDDGRHVGRVGNQRMPGHNVFRTSLLRVPELGPELSRRRGSLHGFFLDWFSDESRSIASCRRRPGYAACLVPPVSRKAHG